MRCVTSQLQHKTSSHVAINIVDGQLNMYMRTSYIGIINCDNYNTFLGMMHFTLYSYNLELSVSLKLVKSCINVVQTNWN